MGGGSVGWTRSYAVCRIATKKRWAIECAHLRRAIMCARSIVCLCGCARGRGGARAGVPASVRENCPKSLPTGGFRRITH